MVMFIEAELLFFRLWNRLRVLGFFVGVDGVSVVVNVVIVSRSSTLVVTSGEVAVLLLLLLLFITLFF